MRVAIATESFLPQVNGVTNSVRRVAEHLRDNGHDAIIIAPSDENVPSSYAGFPVTTLPSVALPMYQDVRMALTPSFVLDKILADFAPDVLHAAAPFLVGSAALVAAAHFSIPSVAVYQTDVPSYAARYGLGLLETAAWNRVRDIHLLANLTLAPSSPARDQLVAHGIPRVKIWGRGVDTERFAPSHRDEALHDSWAPAGEVVIGYMGRLAPEKQVADLVHCADIAGTRLVIVGDGPSRKTLGAALPTAHFLGRLGGDELARVTATIDVFVHPGELETFGQAIQEALASGVPVIAPAKGGPQDLIKSGRWGFLYPPGDLALMRALVEQLVADTARRLEMSLAAREFTSSRTWPVICAQLLDYYREVIAMTAAAVPDLR
ncbi:MAG: glycosyltransferase family 1 protein [Propionibacteriaceae bacterium]|jgi:phosphatidylinositol alpha 1,6-mannosyltransferase|nr:glycosyltransferase family 1 protein [Propionibacteriaceae bacterium]